VAFTAAAAAVAAPVRCVCALITAVLAWQKE
jgi:hypothetical protein